MTVAVALAAAAVVVVVADVVVVAVADAPFVTAAAQSGITVGSLEQLNFDATE